MTMTEHSVTLVKAVEGLYPASSVEQALARAEQAGESGIFDEKSSKSRWRTIHTKCIAVPSDDTAQGIKKALMEIAALRELRARHDDEQALRLAKELSRSAMELTRHEMQRTPRPEIIQAATYAFASAKISAANITGKIGNSGFGKRFLAWINENMRPH